MQIIPVIDLKDGLVVHAAGGDRSRYQPIHHASRLCGGSEIGEVVASFLNLYPFQRFYIADLDAIAGHGNHAMAIEGLLKQHPDVVFWVDKGSHYQAGSTEKTAGNYKPVFGTESQAKPVSLVQSDAILSLDFKHNQVLGHPDWLESPEFWPDTIVVMTLDVVGSNKGPDFNKLTKLRLQHGNKQMVAAGGVRDIDDLIRLEQIGMNAVLLASALHNGNIDAEALKKF